MQLRKFDKIGHQFFAHVKVATVDRLNDFIDNIDKLTVIFVDNIDIDFE